MYPKCSMVLNYMYPKNDPNVGKYTRIIYIYVMIYIDIQYIYTRN
jgi:hypothetical protein